MDTMSLYTPLRYLPVLHTCSHFEARLMRWYAQADADRGYAIAGNPCSQCDAQGRPLQPSHPDLGTVQAACRDLDAARAVGGRD